MKPTGFVGRLGAYIAGCLIVVIGLNWSEAVTYSTIPEIRRAVALVLGPYVAISIATMHFGFQVP